MVPILSPRIRSVPHIVFIYELLIIVVPYTLGLSSGLFPSGFPTAILYVCLVSPIQLVISHLYFRVQKRVC